MKIFPLGRWESAIYLELRGPFADELPEILANALSQLQKEDPNVAALSPDVWDHTSALGGELQAFAEVVVFEIPEQVDDHTVAHRMVAETLDRLDWFLIAEAVLRKLEFAEF